MKNTILILFVFFTTVCKSQSPVIDITEMTNKTIDGAYYKDINNYLDNFVGTWLYTNDNTTLKITLKKEVRFYNTVYYEDFLIGEYQYIENGVEKINTLSDINTVLAHQRGHNINGNIILENNSRPKCEDCLPNEKRVSLIFSDPIRQLGGKIILRRTTENGKEVIKAYKRTTNNIISMNETSPYSEMLVPSGHYTLIKQ